MNPVNSSDFRYTIGGPLKKDAPSYIAREADRQLYEALKASNFCFVLNSRQMGKSSLRVQVMNRLQQEGIKCGVVDISTLNSASNEEEWYYNFVKKLATSLGIKKSMEVNRWWSERTGYPLDRFNEFIDEEILNAIPGKIIIFVDEIDSILSFQQKDDFFALVRSFHTQRVDNPNYERLAFTFLGVANSYDLIQDPKRTPFNIGQVIDLRGFQKEESATLTLGLEGKVEDKKAAIEAILDWTGGQPFLTQKVCNLVTNYPDQIRSGDEIKETEKIVRSGIIDNWISKDNPDHLKYILKRLTDKSHEKLISRLLGIYRQIVQNGEVGADRSAEQMELRLTGLVVEREGKLTISNRIYQEVFDLKWVQQELAKLRPYREAFDAWVQSGKQDSSCLLEGKALEEALIWSENKLLGGEDEEFLRKSQDKAERLKMINEKNRILAEAVSEAEQQRKTAQQNLSTIEKNLGTTK